QHVETFALCVNGVLALCASLASHVAGAVQVPQLTVPPQPSGAVPQICPVGQVVRGTQTHWLLALHVVGGAQVPQLTVPPQPSGCVPHAWPPLQVVFGTQTHVLLGLHTV